MRNWKPPKKSAALAASRNRCALRPQRDPPTETANASMETLSEINRTSRIYMLLQFLFLFPFAPVLFPFFSLPLDGFFPALSDFPTFGFFPCSFFRRRRGKTRDSSSALFSAGRKNPERAEREERPESKKRKSYYILFSFALQILFPQSFRLLLRKRGRNEAWRRGEGRREKEGKTEGEGEGRKEEKGERGKRGRKKEEGEVISPSPETRIRRKEERK